MTCDKNYSRILWVSMICLVIMNGSSYADGIQNHLEALAKSQLDLCRHTQGCEPVAIRQCEKVMAEGLELCNPALRARPNATRAWSDCLTRYVDKEMGSGTILSLSLNPVCRRSEEAAQKHFGSQPVSQEVAKYFSANGFDLNTLRLYDTKEEACAIGAKITREKMEKMGPVEVLTNLTGIKQTSSISGDGSTSYKHYYKTTVYHYGKCEGNIESRLLRRHAGKRKGSIIRTKYSDYLYVVVDCKMQPKPTICD